MVYKNNKGLTLIEILVSCVITVIVIMYGATFFISSWRLEVDSEEYNKVLQYAANIIEEAKYVPTPNGYLEYIKFYNEYDGDRTGGAHGLFTGNDSYGVPINVSSAGVPPFIRENFYIYFGRDVKNIKIKKREVKFHQRISKGIVPMSVLIEWETSKGRTEQIILNTYLGTDSNIIRMFA